MIGPETMNSLLANTAFRAFLAARTQGIASDTDRQRQAAQNVTHHIGVVRGHTVGSIRHMIACGSLLRHMDTYLNVYGEHEPPYLPEGHKRLGSS